MTAKRILDEQYIIDNFEKLTQRQIAKNLNVKPFIIGRRSKALGLIRKQKYTYHVDYFKTWSHDMAYILGFIFADGCIRKTKAKSWILSFGVNIKDKIILEYIAKELGLNLIIKNTTQFDKRTQKTYYSCRLSINCKEMIDDLIKLNICERKTGKEELPEIPEEFKMSFLCGYHDGDGHLQRSNTHGYKLEFTCMSKKFLESIQQEICKNIGKIEENRNHFSYKITRKEPCMKLDAEMTRNVSFYLKRKHFV